jgi:hypothetical protein
MFTACVFTLQYVAFGYNESAVIHRTKDIVNIVSQVKTQLPQSFSFCSLHCFTGRPVFIHNDRSKFGTKKLVLFLTLLYQTVIIHHFERFAEEICGYGARSTTRKSKTQTTSVNKFVSKRNHRKSYLDTFVSKRVRFQQVELRHNSTGSRQ